MMDREKLLGDMALAYANIGGVISVAGMEAALDVVEAEIGGDHSYGPLSERWNEVLKDVQRTIPTHIIRKHGLALGDAIEEMKAEIRAEEREACAEVAENMAAEVMESGQADKNYRVFFATGAKQVAAAIRARSA